MDAFDIARLMANQDPSRPVKLRYGTVEEIGTGTTLQVVPDGQTHAVPAVRCCDPVIGARVVLLVDKTEWIAVATIGACCPYQVGDLWVTFSSDQPEARWPGTSWKKVQNVFLLASGSRAARATGGAETHKLSVEELPAHSHALAIYSSNWSDVQKFNCNSVAWGAWTTSKVRLAHPSPGNITTGGDKAHNNMPPFQVVNMWERTA